MTNPKFPYPFQYISASPIDLPQKELLACSIRNNIIGAITGETGIPGLKLDFNYGLRLQVPQGKWHIRITDLASECVFFDDMAEGVILNSIEKYFIQFHIEASLNGTMIFSHDFNPEGQEIFFYSASTAIGDTLAMLPYIKAFKKIYGCQVVCYINPAFHAILAQYYGFPQQDRLSENTYATYYLGAWQDAPLEMPADARIIPLTSAGNTLLRLNQPVNKDILKPTVPRKIREKYVCIAIQASGPMKNWWYPNGWNILTHYLKTLGYRVLCIDREKETVFENYTVTMPEEAEDFTGNIPLMDRLNLLAYADFFIGLSSGLAWLANAADIPVILISGFTLPFHEFYTPYRIINPLVCHGCFHDLRLPYAVCPKYKDTEREHECTKKIAPGQIIRAIQQIIHTQHRKNTP